MAFKTRADLTPFLNQDISFDGGALEKAFKGIAKMVDGHGENADAKLLTSYKDATDASKINEKDFYNPFNALKAKELVKRNQQNQRVLEQQARDDSEYYRDVFNKEATNDAFTMNKDEWNKKYNNAGGYDAQKVQSVWDRKEDRAYLGKQREKEEQKWQNYLDDRIEQKRINKENRAIAAKNRARQDELNSRVDSKYYRDTFTQDAIADAYTMTQEDWNKKYSNAGGIDMSAIQKVWDEKKNRKRTDTQIQREDEKWNDYVAQKGKTDAGKKLLNDVYSGTIQTEEGLAHYADSVDPSTFSEAKKVLRTEKLRKEVNNISSKYTSFDEFKKSEDWKNTSWQTKDALAKSKVWGEDKKTLTFEQQRKQYMEETRKKELPTIATEYEEKTGKKMSVLQQNEFIINGKMPKELEVEEKKALPTKEAKDIDGLVKYKETLDELEKAYRPRFVGGVDTWTMGLPNPMLGDEARKFNSLMQDVLLGKTSALSGTLSDKDMALLKASGLTDALGEEDFINTLNKAKVKVNQLLKERYNLLDESYNMPEHYGYINDINLDEIKKMEKPVTKAVGRRANQEQKENNIPEVIKTLKNPQTGEMRKWSNIRGFINE